MAARIVSKSAYLEAYKPHCEVCGAPTNGAGPHHVIGRKAGGPDHALNLIQLCFEHHTSAHCGRIKRDRMFDIIAKRESWAGAELVEDDVRLMMRTGKTMEDMEE